MHDAIKSCTIYDKASEDSVSEARTCSYLSEDVINEDDDDDLSEPEIAVTIEKSKFRYDKNGKRLLDADGNPRPNSGSECSYKI